MVQSKFEKSMKNVNLKEKTQNRRYSNYTFNLDINANEKKFLRAFQKHELGYYNKLVSSFATRTRTMPDLILSISGDLESLMLAVAEYSVSNIYDFIVLKKGEFPSQLERFRKIIESDRMSESYALLLSEVGSSYKILPEVRKRMVTEIIKFYKAIAMGEKQIINHENQVYKNSLEQLAIHDDITKRHLQIPRNSLKISFDKDKDETAISVPYLTTPIVISGMDLSNDKGWNYAIIHQEAGRVPTISTPWIVELKSIQNQYLLKFVDTNNSFAGSSFSRAK